MDYQEVIKEAETQINMYESMILYNKDFEPKNDNSNYERKLDFLKTAISAMQELQEYKQLGTLEEVREEVEKQSAKKPKTKTLCGDIEWWCPNCGESHIMMDSKKGFDYCHHCGQKLDWSEKDEQIN